MQSHESLEGCEDGPVASKRTTEDDGTASGHVGGLRAEDRANPLAHSSVVNSDSLRFGLQRQARLASASACKLQEFLALVSQTNLRPRSEASPVRWEVDPNRAHGLASECILTVYAAFEPILHRHKNGRFILVLFGHGVPVY